MSEEFYQLENVETLDDARELSPRAAALLEAVRHHRDFTLVKIGRKDSNHGVIEFLVVDMCCHGVPKYNDYGLQFRERLALVIPAGTDLLPMVWAMRKNFPRLAHQHRATPDLPANLCLYFEPPLVVFRTWTPESFLARILWWFEKNARGELHLADQPLDHLFFASRHELIIPWDYDAIRQQDPEFIIAQGERRPDGGSTLYLHPKRALPDVKTSTALLIEATLQPILAGAIEAEPVTLGQLSDLMGSRGATLLPALVPKLRELVDAQGSPTRSDAPLTVILLNIPLCRDSLDHVERISVRAFIVEGDPLQLGVATGALMRVDGRIYSAIGLLDAEEPTAWRDLAIEPIEILHENTPALARRQSGIEDKGPKGVLLGAGSLGSALLELWTRSGWGSWTIVDKDHIKPHNLSRHIAINAQIGDLKVNAVAVKQQAITRGAAKVIPLAVDALDRSNAALNDALNASDVVLDATAALEYPRQASLLDTLPRHASVFVTPSGNAAVALVEDLARARRLRTLESQYYRAIIESDWGREHLEGNQGTFWSGASCRDISLVLPYARVMAHACQFSEQLPTLLASPGAAIRVWQRTSPEGDLAVHALPVEDEIHFDVDDGLTVYLDVGLKAKLEGLRASALPSETGGILLGYYDFNVKALCVVTALPAPADSVGSTTSFERGIEGLKAEVEEISRRTAGIVGYVGEWHSHPKGHSSTPSDYDVVQLVELTLGMAADGLPAIQMIVGERDLSLSLGAVRR